MGDNINRGDLVEEMLNSINESGELNSKSWQNLPIFFYKNLKIWKLKLVRKYS
jgi:hypothetical protein